MIKQVSPTTYCRYELQQKRPLTRNGNEYNPMVAGTVGGLLVSGSIAKDVVKSGWKDVVASAKKVQAIEGLKDKIKPALKTGTMAAKVLGIAGIIVGLGMILGHNIIDAPINQVKRDQADGEAAKINALLNLEA